MSVVVDCHLFCILFERPCQGNQKLQTSQCNLRLQSILCSIFRPSCENLQQISSYEIRLCQTSCYIQPIRLFVVKLEPFLKIPETCQSIVSKHVLAIFIGTTSSKLERVRGPKDEQCMELTAVTRLDTYARTSGSTTSLLPSANSMVRGVLESSKGCRYFILGYLTRVDGKTRTPVILA